MSLTIEDFKGIENNPNAIVYKLLQDLENNGYTISNPDNAFVYLMESCAALTQASTLKFKEELRKVFPSLATDLNDLYPHLTDEMIPYLFAKPGTVTLRGVVYIMSMKEHGLAKGNYRETVIPAYSTFTYNGNITFMLMNDIRIRVFNQTENVEVCSIPNNGILSDNSTAILDDVRVSSDGQGNPYVMFPLKCLQVNKYIRTGDLFKYETTLITHKLVDKFYCAEAFIVDLATKAETKIDIKYTEEYLDTNKPSVFIRVLEDKVEFRLPNIFTKVDRLSGQLKIVVYECKGSSYLPMYNATSADIEVTISKERELENNTIFSGVKFLVTPDNNATFIGGSDPLNFLEIKDKIIHHSFTKQLPVTDYDIVNLGLTDGFILSKVEDNLTSRTFIASKNLDGYKSLVMKSIPDVFNNLAKITLNEYATIFPDNISSDMSTFFIPSGTIFKEMGGYVKPLTKEEIKDLHAMSVNDKIRYLRNNKLFFNPFYYVIDTKKNLTESKVYSLDAPMILSYLIRDMNNNIPNGVTANVTKYEIIKQSNGYRIYIVLTGNSTFNEIRENNVKLQLTMFNKDGIPIYFKFNIDRSDVENPYWYVDIETDFKISTDQIEIINGDSTLGTKLVNFKSKAFLHCYLTAPDRFEETRFLVDEIQEDNPNTVVVFKSEIEISLGEELTYLWNRLYNTYSSRKYLRYDVDKPKRYLEDVYQRDSDGNLIYTISPDGDELVLNKLHSKGEIVKDEQGNEVYEYRKGDVVLQDGEPVVDEMSGVIRSIEMLMLEYEYMVGDDPMSKRILESAIEYIYKLITLKLPEMNSKLLEKTTILYRGNKRTLPISTRINGITTKLDFNLKPVIKMYVDKDTNMNENVLEVYRKSIGILLNRYINKEKEVLVKNLIDAIYKEIANDGVKGISITAIVEDELNNIIFDDDNRPIIGKRLVYTVSKMFEVEYDIDIEVVRMI